MLPSWVFQRKLPLNDTGCIPHNVFLRFEACKGSVFKDHISHTSSLEIPMQLMDSRYLITCMFQSSTFADLYVNDVVVLCCSSDCNDES